MAAILASNSCNCRNVELMNQGTTLENLNFSNSISVQKFSKFGKKTCNLPTNHRCFRFQVEMRQTESSARAGINGKAVKMVPTSEVVLKRKTPSINGVETVNGTRKIVNGASLVRKDTASAMVKSPKIRRPKELPLPPVEELKVLPSDEGFSWAKENYNSWQRSIDVWSFVLSLRVRVLLDNAKWAYIGGFTEDKQVSFIKKKIIFVMSTENCFAITSHSSHTQSSLLLLLLVFLACFCYILTLSHSE